MGKIFLLLAILTIMITGCNSENKEENNIADGNVTPEEAEMMQQEWCDYNKGRDFALKQCEEYWKE